MDRGEARHTRTLPRRLHHSAEGSAVRALVHRRLRGRRPGRVAAEEQGEIRHFVSGSAERAIKIGNKPFDKLIFIEQDAQRCSSLGKLKESHAHRDIQIVNGDANVYLSGLGDDWGGRRGVLFLDPFATQVRWATLERVASYRALDTWLLFPVSAISRMLPTLRRPDEIDEGWVSRLTTVYGDESWRDLYRRRAQPDLFIEEAFERDPGVDGLCSIYQDKLSDLFGDRYLACSRTLKNSRNSALFQFLFCAGHPAGSRIAKDIAGHILRSL